MKFFNVAKDYSEQNDLAAKMPKKVAELDRIRKQYIDEVDGGKMEDIYAACLESLEENRNRVHEKYLSNIEIIRQKKPDDFETQKAKLDAAWEMDKRGSLVKTEILKAQMSNASWRKTLNQEVMKRLGVVDKKGTKMAE